MTPFTKIRRPLIAAFDLDGTVVDSWRDIKLALQRTLEPRGLPVPSDVEVQARIGLPAAALFADSPCDAPVTDLVDEFRAHLADHLGTHSVVFPETASVLTQLGRRGWICALATNKPPDLAHLALDRSGLKDLFQVIVGPGLALRPKPAPDILFACLKAARARSGFMVGDTPHDVDAGARAGLTTVLVVRPGAALPEAGEFEPDYTIEDLMQILDLDFVDGA